MQTVIFNFKKILYRYAKNEIGTVDAHTFHHHLDYELLIILKGEGQFVIGDHSYPISAGTIILVPPGNYHIMNISASHVYERLSINFTSDTIPSNLDVKDPIIGRQTVDTEDVTNRILKYQSKFESERFEMLLIALISEFMIIFDKHKDSYKTGKEKLPEIVFKTVNYIRDNICNPLNAEIIAKSLFVSKSHLISKFRETMTITLGDYIRIQKMLKAREMLKEGLSPTVVCEKMGYMAYSTFLRNYRMEFGDTPKHVDKS